VVNKEFHSREFQIKIRKNQIRKNLRKERSFYS